MTHPINSYQNCDDESHVHPYEKNVEAKHVELLQKLADIAHKKDAHEARNDYLLALRAVVELHKPILDMKPGFDQCSVCLTIQPYDVWNSDYPCPTIQAIEKELV